MIYYRYRKSDTGPPLSVSTCKTTNLTVRAMSVKNRPELKNENCKTQKTVISTGSGSCASSQLGSSCESSQLGSSCSSCC